MDRAFAFDMYLLARFQRVSHWVQRQVGWKSCDLAYGALFVGTVFAVAHKQWVMVVMAFVELWNTASHQRMKSRNQDVMEYHPALAVVRLVVVVMALIVLLSWEPVVHGYVLGFLLNVYFRACNDLPESKSKVRQWLESLTISPVPAPQRLK